MSSEEEFNTNKPEYFLIIIILVLFGLFISWAHLTQLDLVTRGVGRVIADGQNKNVQSPDRGVVERFLVEEGSIVSAGQIIASINPIEAEGVLDELQVRLNNFNLKILRLQTELNKETIEEFRAKTGRFPSILVEAEIALMQSRRDGLATQLGLLEQDKKRASKKLSSLKAEIDGQGVFKSLLNKEKKEILPLVDAGVLGTSERFRLEREDAEIEMQLEVLEEKLLQAQLEMDQIDESIVSVQIEFDTKIYAEQSQVIAERAELEVRLPTVRQKLQKTEIRSPISGVVNRVFYNSTGAVLASGDIIAEIVPTGESLLLEAFIDPKDIATVEPGQKAQISLTAYDPTKYGYLQGTLTKVSADTVYKEETQSSAYEVNVSIDTELYEADGSPVTIVPGMVAQVDVIRGQRSILEYFWQPIAKIKDTAFRE